MFFFVFLDCIWCIKVFIDWYIFFWFLEFIGINGVNLECLFDFIEVRDGYLRIVLFIGNIS